MEKQQVSRDDIQDIYEMTIQIENTVCKILKGNDLHIARSALITSFVNLMILPCTTTEEASYLKETFNACFDKTLEEGEDFFIDQPAS